MTKKLFDLISSFLGLIILSPIFVIIAILIKLESEGPIFFRQERVGKEGRIFRIHKFRSMTVGDEKSQLTVKSDSRITKTGAFLRRYKIDELPQLIDVIAGNMSIVGPRPEVPRYVECYSGYDRKIVLSVKPGITDIASIRYKDENNILEMESDPVAAYINKILPKKLRYCRFYVAKQSFCLDITIIFWTIRAIVS